MRRIGWTAPSLRPESDLRLIPRQAFRGYLSEGRSRAVLLGEQRCLDRPLYTNLRVVPEHRGLGLCVVSGRALIDKEHHIAGNEEAVGESLGNVELALVLRGEDSRLPLSEGWRADSNIHGH